ncbi:hypothetical protein Tco_0724464, partial [Tanacetum coccineum]
MEEASSNNKKTLIHFTHTTDKHGVPPTSAGLRSLCLDPSLIYGFMGKKCGDWYYQFV